MIRKVFAAGLIALASLAGSAQAEPTKKLVTIVTSPNAQTKLMSFVLTLQALAQGAKAHILLCGPGGDIALKNAPESATAPLKPKGMSPKALLMKLMGAGAVVEVCAIYLPNKGVGADALIDGVTAAKPKPMAARLIADDTTVLSF